jgi:Na+-transporting methylmalonyl-CoA/oxaloacetate decarboxylase gamma subunit
VDPATAKSWLEILRDLGLGFTAALAFFVWALSKGKLRWDWDAERCEKTSKEWQARAETDTALVAKTTAALERNADALDQLVVRVKRLEAKRP